MRPRKAVRLPLQTGASSLKYLLGSFVAAAVLFSGTSSCMAYAHPESGGAAWAMVLLVIAGVLAGALLFLYFLGLARHERASDVVLDPDGVVIEGGSQDALSWAWVEMDPSRTKVLVDHEHSSGLFGKPRFGSKVVIEDQVVGASLDVRERRSFHVLAHAIRDALAPDATRAPAAAPSVLLCSSCGAPVVPADAESVICNSCGAAVAVAAELRERVRAAALLAKEHFRSDKLVGKVLRQPGARRTNLLIFMVGVALYGGGLVALAVRHEPRLIVFPAAVLVVMIALARADIATRHALRAIMTGFASRPPARPGEPSTCRRCGAPLAEPPAGSVVSRCVYCRAANVMGTDLRADAEEATAAESELATALRVRRTEAVIRIVALAALLVTVIVAMNA